MIINIINYDSITRNSKSAEDLLSEIDQKEKEDLLSELVKKRFIEIEQADISNNENNYIPTKKVIDKMNDCLLCFQTRFNILDENNTDFLVDLSSKILIKDMNISINQNHFQKLSAILTKILKETYAIPILNNKNINIC
jgi:hypothetical protein